MSHRSVALPLAAALAGLAACAPASRVDTQAEAAAIRELDRQWQAAVEARDLEAMLSFYAPDAVEMPANGPPVVGVEAIRQMFNAWLADTNITNTFEPQVIEVAAAGDLAYDRGTYRTIIRTAQGPIEDVGKYVIVWKKMDGQWRAVADIANSSTPLPTPGEKAP